MTDSLHPPPPKLFKHVLGKFKNSDRKTTGK